MIKYGWYWIIVVSLLLASIPAFADDTLLGESGHSVYPINTDKIRMEFEHVVIKMEDMKDLPNVANPARRAVVTCEFIFENTSSEEIRAQVGFPGNEFNNHDFSMPDLRDFTALVDDREMKVVIKKQIVKEVSYGSWIMEFYRNWYTWEVLFPPNKKIRITNSYWIIPSSTSVERQVEYVLATGANWKGNIEQAIIEVLYASEHDLKARVIDIKPQAYRIEGRRIKWDLREFKPTANIKITEKVLR